MNMNTRNKEKRMRQFTVYAKEGGSGCAVYTVNFTGSGVIAYPLREKWSKVAERMEKEINREHFAGSRPDPFEAECRN